MHCPTCRRENRADARFCLGCGGALPRACAGCGRELPADAAFCDGCGHPTAPAPAAVQRDLRDYTPRHLADRILRSRSALEGERKQVTVLFADVKGSVELAERVDAEEWHQILDHFFQLLAEGVHRYEGTINQYTGDGVMALFGAPIAHEDHAQRACHAALHLLPALRAYAQTLRRERGLDFSVRMGLNSGEVVVGRIGDDLRMDYTAQGATVGLAARIQQVAEGGEAYLSDDTAGLVSGYFRLEDLGEFHLKGIEKPIRVHALRGEGALRSRLEVSRQRGFSRFVGRERDLAALERALERAHAGEAPVVSLVAEAGTGKSRLCHEFAERCRGRGVTVRTAQALSHGGAVPLLPVLELLRGLFGIAPADLADEARQKVAGALTLLSRDVDQSLPLVLDALGLADPERPTPSLDPDERGRQLIEIAASLVEQRSRREPLVVLLEDLHWLDPGSEAFLHRLIEQLDGARVLWLTNHRPGWTPPWSSWRRHRRLALRPLDAGAAGELLADLLGDHPSVAPLSARIAERTAGNPFFIEETVRALAEDGLLRGARGRYELAGPLERLTLPRSVQTVLAARIDRLAEREKSLLQTAAVVGKRFSVDVLAAVLEVAPAALQPALEALTQAEFVTPVDDGHAFVHPLTQEVAYRSQLRGAREEVHAAVARALADADPSRRDERAALVAHHLERAGKRLEAARWHRRAAEAEGLVDIPSALLHWRRVRALCREEPGDEARRLELESCWRALDYGTRYGIALDEARELFESGLALCDRCGEQRARVTLHETLATRLGSSGDLEGLHRHLAEARRVADEVGDLDLVLVVLQRRWVMEFHRGDFREALALAEEGVARAEGEPALSDPESSDPLYRRLLLSKANTLQQMGRLDESAALLDRVAERTPDRGTRARHSHALIRATLAYYRGDAQGALREAGEFVALAERSGSTWAAPMSMMCLGRAHLLGGRHSEARGALETSVALARRHRLALEGEAGQLALLAEACALCGDAERAIATAREAVENALALGARFWELQARAGMARVLLLGKRDAERIAAEIARGEELVDETGGEVMRPTLALRRAELAALSADEGERARWLRTAHVGFAAMGAAGHAARLASALPR